MNKNKERENALYTEYRILVAKKISIQLFEFEYNYIDAFSFSFFFNILNGNIK